MIHEKLSRRIVKKGIKYLVLTAGAVIAMFPFYWMLSSSFKIGHEILQYPPIIFPSRLTLEHYLYVFSTLNVPRVFMNSVIVSVSTVLLNAFFSGMVAYALAKLRFPGKNVLFFIVLAFMMVPFQLLMVPLFLQISNLGLIGKYSGIILPSAISSFSIFLLRQALISLPNDYIEAALIDGAHHFNIFFRIIVPMIVPAFVTVMLTNFFWSWNSYVWPMMVSVQHDEIATMQVAIARYRTLQDMKWGATMAACTLTAFPIVIVYLFMQSQFIESVAQSGLKG
jgi:multiple sugar transport system permease protein